MKEEGNHNVDQIIREALGQKETEDILRYSADPGLFDLIGSTFRGRLRWVVMLAFVMSLVYFGAFIFCAFKFYHASEVKNQLAWGGGAVISFLIVVAHKQWYWLEMTRRSLSRDIKRLQLQVADLAEKGKR